MFSDIDELLGEGERVEVFDHPSRLGQPYIWFYLAAVLLIALDIAVYSLFDLGWFYPAVALVVPLLVVAVAEIKRAFIHYYVTTERVVVETGIFSKDIDSGSFDNITDVGIDKGVVGRFLDVGRLSINTAGADAHEIVLDAVYDPEEFSYVIDDIKQEHEAAEQRRKQEKQRQQGEKRRQQQRAQRPSQQRSMESMHTPGQPIGVASLQAELGRLEREKHMLEQQRDKGLVTEDEYGKKWYILEGRMRELNDLIDRIEGG